MKPFRKGLSTVIIAALGVGTYMAGDSLVSNVRFARAETQVQSSREDLKKMDDIAGVYRTVGKAVEPSVVNIEVHKTIKHRGVRFDDDLLRQFFDNGNGNGDDNAPPAPRGRRMPMPNPNDGGDNAPDELDQVASGSGVIMEAGNGKGYILTNNHVAGGAESMTITLSDGRKIAHAKVLGTDPKSDLAVVEIAADKLIPAQWGDSDSLAKGDIIFAFGSPFGYIGSMTHGIVSALNRQDVGIVGRNLDFRYENFIQVDAPINPGNSGGPLVNLHGEVVGINTAIATETGAFNGIGFAIPSNQAKTAFNQLKDKGKVVRGYLGVGIQDINPELAQTFNFKGDSGVVIGGVMNETPAEGKLRKGDIVTAIDGKPVKDMGQLRNTVAATEPGKELTFTVFRKGKTEDVKLKIGEQPESIASRTAKPIETSDTSGNNGAQSFETTPRSLGLKLTTPNEDLITRFGLESDVKGALVTNVDRHSAAERAGIMPGDVITEIGDDTIESTKQATEVLAKQDLGKGIRMSITNRQGSRFVVLKEEAK